MYKRLHKSLVTRWVRVWEWTKRENAVNAKTVSENRGNKEIELKKASDKDKQSKWEEVKKRDDSKS